VPASADTSETNTKSNRPAFEEIKDQGAYLYYAGISGNANLSARGLAIAHLPLSTLSASTTSASTTTTSTPHPIKFSFSLSIVDSCFYFRHTRYSEAVPWKLIYRSSTSCLGRVECKHLSRRCRSATSPYSGAPP
jgi:hypothetical protein